MPWHIMECPCTTTVILYFLLQEQYHQTKLWHLRVLFPHIIHIAPVLAQISMGMVQEEQFLGF